MVNKMKAKNVLKRLDRLIAYYAEYKSGMPKSVLLTPGQYVSAVLKLGGDDVYHGLRLTF